MRKRCATPIVEKIRGASGMTARQLARLVEQVLLRANDDMLLWQGKQAAQIFKDASPHWLRHAVQAWKLPRTRTQRRFRRFGTHQYGNDRYRLCAISGQNPGQEWQTTGGLTQYFQN